MENKKIEYLLNAMIRKEESNGIDKSILSPTKRY